MEQNREMRAMGVIQLPPYDAENYQEAAEAPGYQCPRCGSTDTKFGYYNNCNLKQPRHHCKNCKKFWTLGGSIRDIPIGGTSRRAKRAKKPSRVNPQWNPFSAAATVVPGPMPSLMSAGPGTMAALPWQSFPQAHPAFMSDSGSVSAAHKMPTLNLLGLTDPELTLLGVPNNPYEISNMMGSGFALSGDLNFLPSDLLQQQQPPQQQQPVDFFQGNYFHGLEMPISQQFAIQQSPIIPNLHSTDPSKLQQSFNIGNGALDSPDAVLRGVTSSNDMGGSSMDPIYWPHVSEFGPFV